MIPDNLKRVSAKAAEYIAFLAVFGTVGTYWINTEVERRMLELAEDPATHPVVVELKTTQNNLAVGQQRIEGKVDAFSQEFLKFLERQSR
jgi:hypothetical protein